MGVRDVIGWQNFNRLLSRRKNRWKLGIDIDQPTAHDDILRDIATLPMDWHGAGVCMSPPLRAMTILGGEPLYSAETGCGLSTLLMSHISQHHTVFCIDDTGGANSLMKVRESCLLKRDRVEFVLGPTQQTLPRHTFEHPLQLVLIDGPHGYPFPELEYYFFYPHLAEGGLLVIDDIHIPTIFRLFSFLRDEKMFDLLGVTSTTAFFRRNASPLFDPTSDGWWLQAYNQKRFLVSDLRFDLSVPGRGWSPGFARLMQDHWPSAD